MSKAAWVGLLLASLVCGGFCATKFPAAPPTVWAATPAKTNSQGLVTLTTQVGDHQQLVVIDPETHVMAVYHIDAAKGEIVLRSVRNIHYDLQMIEFNGTSPLPGDIRNLLGQK